MNTIKKSMNDLQLTINPKVKIVFDNYPKSVRNKMLRLRKLVIEAAKETDGVTTIEETLKWGEPSYLTKYGSTIRMDWKSKSPRQYAVYFKCTSKLVETFKMVFDDRFQYEGNRAIIFQLKDKIPVNELKSCIKAALTYHKVKHLPALGLIS